MKMTLVDPGPVGAAATTALFAQIAIGGGFSTEFTALNTGSDALVGDLFLTGDDGNLLNASISSVGSVNNPPVVATSAPINAPPGGAEFITADPVTPNDPTKAGWARIISSGGSPSGVAAFQLASGSGTLASIAGVLASQPVSVATIPADDDSAANRFTGYAIANQGSQNINIKIVIVNGDGSVSQTLNPPLLNPLAPGAHVARFLFQDLNNPNLQFKGSMVLIAQGTGTFTVVALSQDRGLFTAIPVVPAKAPHIN